MNQRQWGPALSRGCKVRNVYTESHGLTGSLESGAFHQAWRSAASMLVIVAQGYQDMGQVMREPVKRSTSNPEVRGEKITGSFNHVSVTFKEWG